MISECTCKHEYQDQKYGRGNRVFNILKSGNHRCTVCGKTKTKSTGSTKSTGGGKKESK